MPVRYEDSLRMAEHLVRVSTLRATGEGEDICLYDRPRQRYFVGALATPTEVGKPGVEFISRLSPSAIGLDVLAEPEGAEPVVEVRPALSVYYRILPEYEQQVKTQASHAEADEEDAAAEDAPGHGDSDDMAESSSEPVSNGGRKRPKQPTKSLLPVYRKVDVEIEPISVQLRSGKARAALTDSEAVGRVFEEAFEKVRQRMVTDPARFRRPSGGKGGVVEVPEAALRDATAFQDWLNSLGECDELPQWKADLTVEERPEAGGLRRLTVRLMNKAEDDRHSSVTDHFLFNCRIELTAQGCKFRPFTFNMLPKDYRYDRRLWGYGQNCSVEAPEGETAYEALRLVTNSVPVYRQEKYVTADRVEAQFDELSSDPMPVLHRIESAMREYLSDWKSHIEDIERAGREDAETLKERRADMTGFEDEIRRFREGVQALAKYPKLMESFKLMNRVFRNAGAAKSFSSWRLFQIVFIVSLIPDVASREPECQKDYPLSRLDTVDVLWFPTGGGKTESYLGITVFTAFFDRLRGKHAGVSAWTRFPLRLLSLQQLQRIADVMGAAEQVRRSLPKAETMDPFSVGYLVGSNNTPNNLKARDQDLRQELRTHPERMRRFQIISRCPFCGQKTVEMRLDYDKIRLNHVCTNPDCREDVLPVFVVDNEVYRYLPTMIVGTVDKLAAVGNQRKFSQLFGVVDLKCPIHGYGFGECTQKYGCERGVQFQKVSLYDPSPTLQIQDELHLLRESLGNFDAHYETWVDEFQNEVGGVRQKIIAATATIENYEHQVRHLYLRPHPRRFPVPGKELGESFYAETKRHEYRRIFLGVMPYNKTHINAVIDLLLFFHEEIQNLRRLPHQDVISTLGLSSISDEDLEELFTQYDVDLAYVSAVREGDRLSQSITGQLTNYLLDRGLVPLRNIELTGSTVFDDVSAALDELEQPPKEYGSRIHSIVATSMISHGVDISRLNYMLFFGMPRQTAEYIQASSRVGRSHVGLVIVCFNPNRERDRSHYHFFRKYHEYLDRLVEPVPINRWSKFSLRRTFPGLFAGYWLSRVSTANRAKVKGSPYFSDPMRKAILESVLAEGAVLDFLGRVYGVSEPEGAEFGRELVETVKKAFTTALNPKHEMFSGNFNPPPMMSLRDVDIPIPFRPDDEGHELWRAMQKRREGGGEV